MTRLNQEISLRDEELKMKNAIIFDSKKKIADCEKKLKEQQVLEKYSHQNHLINHLYYYSRCMKMFEQIETYTQRTSWNRKMKLWT